MPLRDLSQPIDQLQNLGLTASESKAYLAVVKSGLCTAAQIALEAQLERTEIYPLMSRLVSKGLVEETIDKPKRFRASNLQVAIPNLVQETIKRLRKLTTTAEELVNRLSSLRTTTTLEKRPEVRVITGWSSMQASLFELLASAQREVWMMTGDRQIMRNEESVVAHLLKAISSRHLKARLIAELDEPTVRRLKKQTHLVEIRHCEGMPSHVYGFDDNAVTIGLTPSRTKRYAQASEVLVTHPEGVRVMRAFFETLWERSVPFNAWVAAKEQHRDAQLDEV